LFLNKEDNGEACARLARRHAERRDIPHIEASSNLGRKTHVVVDLKHHVALRMRRLQKTEKEEEERTFAYLGIPSIARSTPAMMRERKRQRALLRLRLRDGAARDATRNSFGVFVCFFREIARGGGGGLKIFL